MCSKVMKQGLAWILCMVLLLGNVTTVFAANDMEETQQLSQELAEEQVTRTQTVTLQLVPNTELADSAELFDAYVQRELYGYEMVPFGIAARETLNQAGKGLYDALKTKIQAVAQAGGKAEFLLDEIAGYKTVWTNTELGVTSIEDDYAIRVAFEEQCDWLEVVEALLSDLPLDMYWYDKVTGASMTYEMNFSGYINGSQTIYDKVTINNITVSFAVSKDYSAGEAFVTTDVTKVQKAKTVAAKVVADNAGKSDYEKLLAYKNYICEAVEYNTIAAGNYGTPYGDPWQLISVFDEDNATKVVCEGYSKAFMYLCDLSDFQGDVTCYTVDGTMNGGNHMWNIVTLENKNYLADITNSDKGTVGQDGHLFLAGTSGSPTTHYTFGSTRYVYSDITKQLWDTDASSILNLAAENYQLSATKPGDMNGDGVVTDRDVISLLWHVLFPSTNPIESNGDINGDGVITDRDVIALLWHVLFPNSNPL